MIHFPRLLGVAAVLCTLASAHAQYVDNCPDATELALDTTITFDTSEAGVDGAAGCVAALAPDIWFKRTPTISGYLVVETCSVGTVVLSAYSGCPGGGSQIACSNGFSINSLHCNDAPPIVFPSTRKFLVPVAAGVPVWVRVACDAANAATNGILKISEAALPANDACSSAQTITPGVQIAFDTVAATYSAADGSFSCGVGPTQTAPDLWYRYTPATSGNATVRVANTLHNLAPLVSIHTSCGSASISCGRANYAANGQSPVYGAQTTFPVTAGTTYYVRVIGGSNFSFPGTLDVSLVANPPANDACAAATNLVLDPDNTASVAFDMTGATNTAIASCNTISANSNFDIWYRYVPMATGTVIFNACQPYPHPEGSVPVQLAAYSDCAGNGLICGTDEVCVTSPLIDGSRAWLDVPVSVGVPVYIRVATASGVTGTGTLHAQFAAPPANDLCANAANVGVGDYSFSTFSGTQDRTASCNATGVDNAADVWFRYTPAIDGILVVNTCPESAIEGLTATLTAYADCNPNSPELLGCDSKSNENFCFANYNGVQITGQQGVLRLSTHAGQPILFRVASAASFPVSPIRRGTHGTIHFTQSPFGTTWFEGNTPRVVPTPAMPAQPDAGTLLSSAQTVAGHGPLTTLYTTTMPNDRADLFKIQVCDPENFRVTLERADPISYLSEGAMFLFDAEGHGVAHVHYSFFTPDTVITNQFVLPLGAGTYYLAVGGLNYMPVDSPDDVEPVTDHFMWVYDYPLGTPERAPDGPAAGGLLAGWSRSAAGDVTQPLRFTLTLSGTCFVCAADFNGTNGLTVQDIFDFLNAWFAGDPRANFNRANGLEVQDIFDFLNAWFAGC